MKTSFIAILFFLATIGIIGCGEPGTTEKVDRLRVKSLTRSTPDNSSIKNISNFKYDSDNRLISIISFQTPDSTVALVGRTKYEYDSQNRLTTVKRSLGAASSEEYKYTYNATNQVTSLVYSTDNAEVYTITYKYNGNTLESSLRKYDISYSLTFRNNISYSFTGQNLASITSVVDIQRVLPYTSTSSSTFTFDDKLNPFFGVYVIPAPVSPARPVSGQFNYYTYYGGYDNLLTQSKDNLLSEVKTSGEQRNYKYSYNEAGYPTSRTTEAKYPGQPTIFTEETLLFEYESY